MATTIKVTALRYYAVEHLLMMLIVVALVTIGRVVLKRKSLDI